MNTLEIENYGVSELRQAELTEVEGGGILLALAVTAALLLICQDAN